MWLSIVFILLSASNLSHAVSVDTGDTDADAEWDAMQKYSDDPDDETFTPRFKVALPVVTLAPALKLPESKRIPASQLYKEYFTPERGSRPVPPLVRSILLPAAAAAPTAPTAPTATPAEKTVEVLCHLDRMYVRILKSVFSNPSAWKYLKLGTCAVNKATDTHYYFLYYLKGCGVQRGEDANRVTYTNALYYKPAVTGPVVWELPFTVPIRCNYIKFRRSYQVGFYPRMVGGTMYRGIKTHAGAALTAMDASWQLLPVGQSFVLGKPICFEAKGPSVGQNERLYMNSCFVTASPNPTSANKYVVVANYGCLLDSRSNALTKFYTSTDRSAVRLCFAAFMFKDMISQPQSKKTMFMHCELDLGPVVPTPSAKSCTYNTQTKKWTELYGDASVCTCCDSTCPAPQKPSGTTMITSRSWDLKSGRETPHMEFMPESSAGQDDFELYWEADEY